MRFIDRRHAGRELARVLEPHIERPAPIYALPRGGVPVAVEAALVLGLPVDLAIARKIGHPWHPEYAICAVTETGEPVCDEDERVRVDPEWLAARVEIERREARRRRELYGHGRERASAEGRCAILVDDGLATGLTMLAAIREVRADRPSRLIVAVPVAPADTAGRIAASVDRFVAVSAPELFQAAVGAYYEDFRQLSDAGVAAELARMEQPVARRAAG